MLLELAGCGGGPPRSVSVASATALSSSSSGPSAPDVPGVPRFDRIDYSHPEKYLTLERSFGSKETIERLASEIPRGADERETLFNIGASIKKRLRFDDRERGWRDVDKMLADGTFGGCADHAVFFGALSRALGIPTVWV